MADPVAVDGPPPANLRALRAVPAPVSEQGGRSGDPVELAAQLAAALRAVRGYVPDRIWWEQGPAEALLTYQATQAS